jgi:hypothetical protein
LFNKIKEKKMKKIYVVLLMSLLLGFVAGSKAKGQQGCNVCPQPNLCYILAFDLPECSGIRAVICYTCAVTHLEAYFEIYLENVCPGMEDEAYEYARNWVLNNYSLLCGSTPCHIDHAILTFTRPICGRVEVVNGRYYIYKGEGDCYRQCFEEWDWCWCNCVPGECWDDQCQKGPHMKWRLISFRVDGSGNCDRNPYPSKCTLIDWRECGAQR